MEDMKTIKVEDIIITVAFIALFIFAVIKSANGQDPLQGHQLYKVVNADGTVTVNGTGQSLAYLLGNMNTTYTGLSTEMVADLNNDGVVNSGDLMTFLGQYGQVLWNQSQFGCASEVGTFACWWQYYHIDPVGLFGYQGVVVGAVLHYPGYPFKVLVTDQGEWWWFENQ